jgi:hypothetical protein
MRHNRILQHLLSCRRAAFNCEQVGLNRTYGKPTSPDKAVKYGTAPCNCRSDHQLARDGSPPNDRRRVSIAAARTSAAIIEICAFRLPRLPTFVFALPFGSHKIDADIINVARPRHHLADSHQRQQLVAAVHRSGREGLK